MVNTAFIDSGVILDVALAREPFVSESKTVLVMAQLRHFLGFTSSVCAANLYYFLRKNTGDRQARDFLSRLLSFVRVLPADHQLMIDALKSPVGDFEDALQCIAARRNNCTCIITRNAEDYREASACVYTPGEFLRLYGE
ncbi:MAG: PIN domain-containing protein [Spirochaetaceae bacterium]|nr:PIN domain-containing protein [Spirochaetaceae bacterium]